MSAVGFDVGGTRLRAGLVEGGKVVKRHTVRVGDDRSPEGVIGRIGEALEALDAKDAPVGVGFAAMLRGMDGFVANSPHYGWRDVPFGEMLAQRLGRAVCVENDLSVITWGEYRFGAGRGVQNVACVFVGTGIGGGAVVDGRLCRGSSNSGLEVGHLKVVPGGNACGCGKNGCVEAYVGGAYLGESPDWTELGQLLGRAIGDLVTILNPERVVMGGSVWKGQPALREHSLAAFREFGNPPAVAAVTIVEDELGDDAGILGAADLATC